MAVALHVAAVVALFVAAERHPRLERRARIIAWSIAPLLLLAMLAISGAFVIAKWLPLLAMPVGVTWVAIVALACWRLVRGDRKVGAWLTATALAVWLSSSNALASLAMARLEAGYEQPSADTRFDALLVLGGGTARGPYGPQLSPSGDRVATAARLYHRGVAPLIVVGGTAVAALEPTAVARDLGLQTRTILLELGVPDEALVVEQAGARNTREELVAFEALCRARGWAKVGLITSAWHLPRAMGHARRAGLAPTPVPADARGGEVPWNIVEIVPSADGAYRMRLWAWEVIGILTAR